jgi:hypothetical protein
MRQRVFEFAVLIHHRVHHRNKLSCAEMFIIANLDYNCVSTLSLLEPKFTTLLRLRGTTRACGSSDPEHVQKVQSHAAWRCWIERRSSEPHINYVLCRRKMKRCANGTAQSIRMKEYKKKRKVYIGTVRTLFLIKHRSFHSCRITRRQVQLYLCETILKIISVYFASWYVSTVLDIDEGTWTRPRELTRAWWRHLEALVSS